MVEVCAGKLTIMAKINVKNVEVNIFKRKEEDYISLTDIAKIRDSKNPSQIISLWLRTYSTIEYLGLWEKLHNADFNPHIYEGFKNVVCRKFRHTTQHVANKKIMTKKELIIYKTDSGIEVEIDFGKDSTCSILDQVAADGKKRMMNLYNLDMIISIGYRVNSLKATQFHQRATQHLKDWWLKIPKQLMKQNSVS